MDKRKVLGRGLSALIPGAGSSPVVPQIVPIKRDYFEAGIEEIFPSPDNPRQYFDQTALHELASSIRNQGLVQPLVVRPRSSAEGGGFTLIAGERRWRAAQQAGLKSVPVVVKDINSNEAFELTLVENLQREDLNPIEEAEAYQRLVKEFGYTQETLGERVGKERATVANSLRLLKLPVQVRQKVQSGELSMGHARAILGLDDANEMWKMCLKVLGRGLSVRQTEALVKKERSGGDDKKVPVAEPPSASHRDLEQRLERAFGTKVRLKTRSPQAGTIEIDYLSLDQLDALLDKFLG